MIYRIHMLNVNYTIIKWVKTITCGSLHVRLIIYCPGHYKTCSVQPVSRGTWHKTNFYQDNFTYTNLNSFERTSEFNLLQPGSNVWYWCNLQTIKMNDFRKPELDYIKAEKSEKSHSVFEVRFLKKCKFESSVLVSKNTVVQNDRASKYCFLATLITKTSGKPPVLVAISYYQFGDNFLHNNV